MPETTAPLAPGDRVHHRTQDWAGTVTRLDPDRLDGRTVHVAWNIGASAWERPADLERVPGPEHRGATDAPLTVEHDRADRPAAPELPAAPSISTGTQLLFSFGRRWSSVEARYDPSGAFHLTVEAKDGRHDHRITFSANDREDVEAAVEDLVRALAATPEHAETS